MSVVCMQGDFLMPRLVNMLHCHLSTYGNSWLSQLRGVNHFALRSRRLFACTATACCKSSA
eukprot:1731444-Pleurochrysis_carterae.AAC.1